MSVRFVAASILAFVALLILPLLPASADKPAGVVIDGDFSDWQGVSSLSDPPNDPDDRDDRYAPRLNLNNPDADILAWKFASDKKYLYVYVRVAGQIGRGQYDDRYYVMVHMDVDRNLGTGFQTFIPFPTEEETPFTDWYYPSNLGSDYTFEAEFRGGLPSRTFITYWGPGDGKLGPWPYQDMLEFREGIPAMAFRGSEIEMRAPFSAFDGHIFVGAKVDVAVSIESSGKLAGTGWCQDSTNAIRGFVVTPSIARKNVRAPRRSARSASMMV